MNNSLKLDQQTFLHVKERLDHYRLPASFPIEATGLLHKLLQLLDGQERQKIYQKENLRYGELKADNQPCCSDRITSSFSPLVDEAVRFELSKQIKQNNQLHLTIMTLKEEISSLKHGLSKTRIQSSTLKNTHEKQTNFLDNNFMVRERELLDELEDLRFKYNQLLDMVHSDDNTEKVYIKKLLKHKNYCSEVARDESVDKGKKRERVVTANESREKDSSKRHAESRFELSSLLEKLAHRQSEIKRLQSKLQFDGINMNRILKDFNEYKIKEDRAKINERVEHLENESHKHKQENAKLKKEGGDKQALRDHVNKLQEENLGLKQKIEAMKKKQKEGQFDEKKEKRKNQRKLNETSGNLEKIIKQKAKDETKTYELQKRQKVLESQIKQLANELENQKQQNTQLMLSNEALQKQLDSEKMMTEYQRQQYNLREVELTDRLNQVRQKEEVMNMGLLRENELLKETVGNLERVQEEVMKRNSFINESTVGGDKTVQNNQLNEFYRQQIAEAKNKLYARQGELIKKQNECVTFGLTVDKLRKEVDHLRAQNGSLRTQSVRCIHLESKLSELTQELHTQKDLLDLERAKIIKYQAQLTDYDKISQEFLTLKDQYFNLQKGEKDRMRGLELRIAELEEVVNMKVLKIEERDIRVNNLESQLVEVNERLRKANRELSILDEQTHKLRMEKNRLEKKHSELLADFTSKKESDKTTSYLKETQLLSEIDKLNRDLHKFKLLSEQQENHVHELNLLRSQNEREMNEMEKLMDLQRQEIENHKQRQQLYEMEIRELKEIADSR